MSTACVNLNRYFCDGVADESGLRWCVIVGLVVLQALWMALRLRLVLLLVLPYVVILLHLRILLPAVVVVRTTPGTTVIVVSVVMVLSALVVIVIASIVVVTLSSKVLIAPGTTSNISASKATSFLAVVEDDATHVDVPLRHFLV